LEQVEAEIVSLSSQLAAASARLIALIGEFDAAEGWREWGMRSTADWLSWQIGIGLNAGREQVRVARALRDLPSVAAEFAAGRLSYSKVRALTRIATTESEAELVGMAEHATAAQIENFVAATRRAIRAADVRARRQASYLRWHQDDDGSIVGSFRLTPEQGAAFCHAVDAGTGKLVELVGEGDPVEDKAAAQRRSGAEVLGLMAEAFLRDVSAETPAEGAERYQLVVHTTADELAKPDDADDDGPGTVVAGAAGRQWRVAPAAARRLTCDCPASTMLDGPDGAALHMGRKTRRIRGRLRRAVHARDRGMCRAPGCTERATQIHHLRHWAHGGPTCLRNLISLCDGHHWLVHEGGFTLVPRSSGGWVLMSLDGVRVGPTPEPHEAPEPLPTNPDVAADAVTGHWDGTTMNTVYAVGAILGLQVPKRQTQTRPAVMTPAPIEDDVSAETWEPVIVPIRDDYPGEPWVGYDDPFFGWCNELGPTE
jgi:hypothetical protein